MPAILWLSNLYLLCRFSTGLLLLGNIDLKDPVQVTGLDLVTFHVLAPQFEGPLERLVAELLAQVCIVFSISLALALGRNSKHIVIKLHFKIFPFKSRSCHLHLKRVIGLSYVNRRKCRAVRSREREWQPEEVVCKEII